jgi:hypothetical protein
MAIRDFDKRPGRLLVVDGKRWKWRLGRANVVAYCEDGEKRVSPAHIVKNVSADEWERRQWKHMSNASITPNDVANWLRRGYG